MRFFKIFILILTSLVFITNFANSKTILGKARIIDGDKVSLHFILNSNKILF